MKNFKPNPKYIVFLAALSITSPNVFAETTSSSSLQKRNWLLGDWDGKRTELKQQGYDFTLAWVNQTATNLHGGFNDDPYVSHAGQFTLAANLDLEKIVNWSDTEAKIVFTKRDGDSIATERTADPRASQIGFNQEIYGRGNIWRLTDAWIRKGFDDNKYVVKFGRMGMGEDFNGAPCEFQNIAFCGSLLGKGIGDLWLNYPISIWGLNVKYSFAPQWTLGLGVYEANPDNIQTSQGRNLDMNGTKGIILPVELTWRPELNDLAGEYKIGGFYSTADAKDVAVNPDGQFTANINQRKNHQHRQSAWLILQQKLYSPQKGSTRGLYAVSNFTFNDTATTRIQSAQTLTLVYKGPFESRPQDNVGFGISHFNINDKVSQLQQYLNDSKGLSIDDYSQKAYSPVQDDEVDLELNYTYRWSPSVMLRPNLQYVISPGAVKQVKDALVAGLTVKFDF